ncbi:MAG: YjgN family protein [Pacificimonas sp.]
MNDTWEEKSIDEAFVFTGRWQEFLPIAVTNLLLTIVTLGVYRFWAKARERRYFWSRTRFVDDTLEWTGTGLEMLIGFIVVMVVLVPILIFFQYGLVGLASRGQGTLAAIIGVTLYAALFYLMGVATYRALRYRLSRTRWHGIRGGSDDGGWGYGLQAMWRYAVAGLTLGLLTPWAQSTLWRKRWGRMSFGTDPIRLTGARLPSGLLPRFLLIYLSPLLMALVVGVLGIFGSLIGVAVGGLDPQNPSILVIGFLAILAIYLVIPLMTLAYYAKLYRAMIGETHWSGLDFAFTANTWDWLKLIFGHIGLVIITLGFGLLFIGYRNWSFFVRHLDARGVIELDSLGQSNTTMKTDAEGLADAFDIGAI